MSTNRNARGRPAAVWSAIWVVCIVSAVAIQLGCGRRHDRRADRRAREDVESAASYQSDVEESLGATVAILVDTSGSMRQEAPGDTRPKYVVALEALEAMLDATEAFIAKRPDFPIKIGIYSFSSNVQRLLAIRAYDRAAVRDALDRLPRPGGGTAIGEALRAARPDLYRAGTGAELRKALDDVYRGKILAEAPAEAEREPVKK